MIICLKKENDMENEFHKTAIKLVPKIRMNPPPPQVQQQQSASFNNTPASGYFNNVVKKIATLSDLIKGGYVTKIDIRFDGMNFVVSTRLNGNEEFILSGVAMDLMNAMRSLENEVLKNQFEI